jgi:elongation factor G
MTAGKPARVHTVALVGHGGAGKTTLAEALLHQAGVIPRPGRVEDGTTVSDFEPEELKRKISVSLAIAPFDQGDHKVNVIDTPGFADFVVEVQLALDAADLAVFVVSAVDGVQVQTEVIWRMAKRAGVPRLIFVNKLDHERADYERTLTQLQEAFGSGLAPLEMPIVRDGKFVGVADLLADEAITYTRSGDAPPVATTGPIPDDMAELEHRLRDNVIEGIVVADDALMERYLEGDVPGVAELEEALAVGIETGTVFPVLCGSALTGVAVGRLASFICEIGHDRAVHARAGDSEVSIARDPAGQPLARVVKTTTDPFIGKVSLLEVVSGTLRPDIVLVNTRTKAEERLHVLETLVGKNATPVSEARAGDLVAVPKLDDVRVGDTLAPKGTPVEVPMPPLARPSFSVAVRPKSRGDEDRLMTGLHRLEEEDPGLSVFRDDETHQTVVSGIGDTHLAVVEERLARKFHVEVEREDLLIPYRETVTKVAEAEGRHKKQTGGHGQFGVCHLRLEPLGRGEGFLFVDEIVGGVIPRQFIPAVEKGVLRAMRQGGAFGFPVVDVKVTVDDGKYHPVDSSEASFEMAGALGFTEALRNAAPVPLEPISRLEVRVPSRFQGDVLGDINTRRARVLRSEPDEDGDQLIVALVPTAELRKYAIELRALSGGYGSFVAAHDHYEPVPSHLADKLAKVSAAAS